MQIAIIITLIILFCKTRDNNYVRILFSVLFSIFSLFGEYIINVKTKEETKEKSDVKSKRDKRLIAISKFLFIAIVIISIVGNNVLNEEILVKENDPKEGHTLQSAECKQYHFDSINIDDKYDIYFNASTTQNDLCRDLMYSLEKIEYRVMPSEEQLEGNNSYGNNALVASHYEELLIEELNNKHANSKAVNRVICNEAICYAEKMDSEYDMPENRKRIVRVTRLSYEYDLADDNNKMQEKCIRYAWGLLYTEISYDKYDEKTIDLLISLYKEINDNSRCIIIISSLEEIKSYFHYDIPHPQKNIK